MNSKTEPIFARALSKKIDEIKVLVVVEKSIPSASFKNIFDKWKYNIVGICASHQAVLDKLKEYKPDLVITDINLNNCNRIELTEKSTIKSYAPGLSFYFTSYATDLVIHKITNATTSLGHDLEKNIRKDYKDFESCLSEYYGVDLTVDHIKQSLAAKPIRILLIDDQQVILWGLKKFFDSEKPRMEVVGTATTISDAKRIVEETKPDIIFLNIFIDNANCINAIPDLTNQGAARVIIFSDINDKEIIDRAILGGARGVVHRKESMQTILRATEKIHDGELWLDRITTGRIFLQNSRLRGKKFQDSEAEKILTLTRKECVILKTFADGMGGEQNKQIAAKLCMSEHTLRNHLTSIFSKLGIKNRFSLFAYAKQHFQRLDSFESINDAYGDR